MKGRRSSVLLKHSLACTGVFTFQFYQTINRDSLRITQVQGEGAMNCVAQNFSLRVLLCDECWGRGLILKCRFVRSLMERFLIKPVLSSDKFENC